MGIYYTQKTPASIELIYPTHTYVATVYSVGTFMDYCYDELFKAGKRFTIGTWTSGSYKDSHIENVIRIVREDIDRANDQDKH